MLGQTKLCYMPLATINGSVCESRLREINLMKYVYEDLGPEQFEELIVFLCRRLSTRSRASTVAASSRPTATGCWRSSAASSTRSTAPCEPDVAPHRCGLAIAAANIAVAVESHCPVQQYGQVGSADA